jgi:hypothetical protein
MVAFVCRALESGGCMVKERVSRSEGKFCKRLREFKNRCPE